MPALTRRCYATEQNKPEQPTPNTEEAAKKSPLLNQAPTRRPSVFTPTSAGVFILTLGGLVWYFRSEKEKHVEMRSA